MRFRGFVEVGRGVVRGTLKNWVQSWQVTKNAGFAGFFLKLNPIASEVAGGGGGWVRVGQRWK